MSLPLLHAGDDSFAADVVAACSDIGFFAVTGHGITSELFTDMRRLCAQVFAADAATKQAFQITPTNYRGFIPLGFFTPNRAEVNGVAPDLYEGFKLHWECPPDHPVTHACDLYGQNRWIANVPDMQAIVTAYWQACERFANELLRAIAPAIGSTASDLLAHHTEPLTNMTLLHYPATAPTPGDRTGIHAHKDTNVFTLLHPDPVGGLEVRAADGSWFEASAPADALVVNTGEMIELWSGGRFAATPHRVINTSGRQRFSFPWFLVPRHDVVVEPLVSTVPGFNGAPMPVGPLSAEVWRTNWPDQLPSATGFDLGALDR